MHWIRAGIWSAAFVWATILLAGRVEADLIRMKNGGDVRCTTIWKEGTMVNCAWGSGNLSFPETMVAEIVLDGDAGYAAIAPSRAVLEAKTYGPGTREQALVHAVGRGDVAAVKKIIADGADIDGLYYSGSNIRLTPVIGWQTVNTVHGSSGAPSGVTPLVLAASRRNEKIVRLLLERGANPNLRSRLDDKGRSSALCSAVNSSSANLEVVRLLLAHNPDKESLETVFTLITRNKQNLVAYVDIFLEHGISPQLRQRVLMAARDREDHHIVHLLEEAYRKHDGGATVQKRAVN